MSGSGYASGTTVSVQRSVAELEKLLAKYGATSFGYGRDELTATSRIMFRLADRMCRFDIGIPDPGDFRRTPQGRARTPASARDFAAAEEQRRWRGLVLVVKALLVAVAEGVLDLSTAFLPYTVLPNGTTVGEWAEPQLDTIYATATMPTLMPGAVPADRQITSSG